jgi:hypothetical protein
LGFGNWFFICEADYLEAVIGCQALEKRNKNLLATTASSFADFIIFWLLDFSSFPKTSAHSFTFSFSNPIAKTFTHLQDYFYIWFLFIFLQLSLDS